VSNLPEFKLPGVGVKCGKCGEVLPRVNRTIKTPGFITRERICDGCGHVNTTSERVIATRKLRAYFSEPLQ
jgi:hypothetical protein